jgi:hypothetical protein
MAAESSYIQLGSESLAFETEKRVSCFFHLSWVVP